MKKLLFLLVALILPQITQSVLADTVAGHTSTEDLSAEARQAQLDGNPVMLLFSANNCIYCERLRNELLDPMARSGKLSSTVHLAEINIDQGGKISDFDGEPVRNRIFVNRYNVFATPTVLLVDYRGQALAQPIIGFNDVSNYRPLLDQAILDATAVIGHKTAGVK